MTHGGRAAVSTPVVLVHGLVLNAKNNCDSTWGDLIDSLRTRLLTLPGDTTVRSGHGGSTSIGAELPHLGEWIGPRTLTSCCPRPPYQFFRWAGGEVRERHVPVECGARTS